MDSDLKRGKHLSDKVSEDGVIDTPEDQKLLRKIDLRLLPIFTLLFLLSFLDRTNIGNAKIDGLTTDLHVSPPAYNTALALYLIAYAAFEVPANVSSLVLKRFGPQFWFPLLTFTWGVASVAQGLITNQAGLFGIRILLGVTEAGLFPGVVFIFSVYYLRRERHWRVAIFFGGASLAGAFGGMACSRYVIGKMDGVGGKRGWQWIFILEGLITIATSVVAAFAIPTWPQKAKWLTDAERSRLLARLDTDSDSAKQENWGYALLFHGFAFVLYTLSLFLPCRFFPPNGTHRMTVPPYVLASIGIASGAWLAARIGRRAPLIIGSAVVAILAGAQYLGVHFAALGVYTGNALLLSWPSENISGQTKRAVGVAMQITIGDLGAITGVLLYRPAFSAHRFRMPHIIAIGYLAFSTVIAGALWYSMAKENRRRAQIIAAGKDEEVDLETKLVLGDREIHWRYRV
ncbi:major facilitator superfamily domain-containing protein [Russula brevipes]|nr:major facilitator superfamily domain-containing protein [Russula brevipes]